MNDLFVLNSEEIQHLERLLLTYQGYSKYMTQVFSVGAILIWISVGVFPSWIKFFMAIAYCVFAVFYLNNFYAFVRNIESDFKQNTYNSASIFVAEKKQKDTYYATEEFFVINKEGEKYQIYPDYLFKEISENTSINAKVLPSSKIIIGLE